MVSATTTFTINLGAAVKLVFIAGATQNLTVLQLSSVITVQRQGQYGNPVTSGITTISLNSNSKTTVFYSDAGVTQTSVVTIEDGSSTVNFWFMDTSRGSPTLTASALKLASTRFKITK